MKTFRVIDFETTGLDAETAEVIEVGSCDINIESLDIIPMPSYLCGADSISPESRAIHHIWMDDIKDCPKFDPKVEIERAKNDNILAFVAHNASFEKQWLLPCDVPIYCTYKAALRLMDFAPTHSNFGLAYWLMDHGLIDIDRTQMVPAHRAGPDAVVTANLLKLMIGEGMTLEQFAQWSSEPPLLPRCPIGEWRDQPWGDVDSGFLNWMIAKEGMSADYKWNARHEMKKRNKSS